MWKERYQKLALYTQQLEQKFQEMAQLFQGIRYHNDETQRLDLQERRKCRLARLTQDITMLTEYVDGPRDPKLYPAGTLIQCDQNGHVYLDNDGDGNLYFPPKLLEMVELDEDIVDWDKVILQG